MADLKLPPYVNWRDGRPRFQPTAREIAQGFQSHDLRHPHGGAWFNYEQACAAGWPLFREILDCRGFDAEQIEILLASAKAGMDVRPKPRQRPHRRGQTADSRAPAPREKIVEHLIEDWLAAIERETDPDMKLSIDGIVSYQKAARALIYTPEAPAERKARRARETAMMVLAQPIEQRKKELFAVTPVSAIDKIALNDMFLYLKRVRGLYMARAAIAAFSAAWEWGTLSHHWRLGANPRHGLALPQPEGRIVILTDAEIRALVAASAHVHCGPNGERRRHSIGDSILLGVMTCQRQRDRLLIKDEGLVDGRRHFRQSKTNKLVPVKETPQLAARCADARRRTAELCLAMGLRDDQRPNTIVVDEGTGRPYNDDTYRNVFAEVRALAIAGLPDVEATECARRDGRNDPEPIWILPPCPSLRFQFDDGEWSYKRDQDLRDTGVTWLARAGSTMAEICAISGHSPKSTETIIRHYLGATRELADAGIDKLVTWMAREGIAV